MPRRPRVELAGGFHHVSARGNRRRAIFLDDRDRRSFLDELAVVTGRYDWTCLTHCLMTNHVHLLVETDRETLGLGMRQLLGRHAQRLNHRERSTGHVFEDRFDSRLVRSDDYFAQVLRYIARNPVVAGLCRDPREWRWSAHAALLAGGTGGVPGRVEGLLEVYGGRSGTRYARLFEDAHPVAVQFGDELPWRARPLLEQVLAGEDLASGVQRARDAGYRVAEIAQALGIHRTTLMRRVQRTGSVPR